MDNTKLIAALEGATGPDQVLEQDIAEAIGWRFVKEGHPIGCVWYDADGRARALPAFTASIDAALTLVPEGMRRRTIVYEDGRAGVQLWQHTDPLPDAWGQAYASEAIATVIAALRAREAGKP